MEENNEPMSEIDIDNIVDEAMNDPFTPPIVEEPQRFPLNPPPIDESISRFSSADWFEAIQQRDITLVGLGGIGSWTSLLLARLKPGHLNMYDPDSVEAVNMAGQLYALTDCGCAKASSIMSLIRRYSDYYGTSIYCQRYSGGARGATKIMICGLDNMDSRKEVFYSWHNMLNNLPEELRKECLFIDGRLAAEEFQIFCMTGEDIYLMAKYVKDWLFDDKDAEEVLCSYKQTSFCANMIASVIVNLLVNFISNINDPVIPRELPFKTTYNSSLMRLTTE